MDVLAGESRTRSRWLSRLATVGVAAGVALGASPEIVNASQEPPMPPAPAAGATQAVTVEAATRGDLPVILNALGAVTALATVTIRPRFGGVLTDVYFAEGQTVRKGDLLAQIDPRPYQAALAPYQRQLETDQALLEGARRELERYRGLTEPDAAVGVTETAAATVRRYERAVASDQAQVDTHKLNLAYCRLTSPIDGRVGLRQVDAGNYGDAVG